MPIIHVSSVLGSATAPYETWTKAATTFAAAITQAVAGDTIYVDPAHTEAPGAITRTWPGTAGSPNFILCGTPDTGAGFGITALAEATAVSDSSTSTTTWNGSFYAYGLNITSTSAATQHVAICRAANNVQVWERSKFRITGGSSTARINMGPATTGIAGLLQLRDCKIRFSHANQLARFNGHMRIEGLSHDAGTTPTTAFDVANEDVGANISISGYDFSDRGATMNLVAFVGGGSVVVEMQRCKPPSGWTGNFCLSSLRAGYVVRYLNSDNAATNYQYAEKQWQGMIEEETTIVRTGGASDGVTPFSMKMISNTNASFPVNPLIFKCKPVWVAGGGTGFTVTVEFIHDSVTNLKDDEIGLRIDYLNNSGAPIAAFADDKRLILGTAADQAASSEAWTTTGLTNPNKQKLSVTSAQQIAGWVLPVVELYKQSATVYVDPDTELS